MKKFEFIDKNEGSIKDDVLSGLTVALALVPEAVAFAFVAGISPVIGLYGAFMMGLVTAIFGGRPGMISGATGALAVVMVKLLHDLSATGTVDPSQLIQYLFITLLFTGVVQILAGVFKLGKFVRMIPVPVMMGFVNGLALIIGYSQRGMFYRGGDLLPNNELMLMIGLVVLTMGIMYFLPKLTKKVPAALAAIIVVSLIVIFGGFETPTVKSFLVEGAKGIDGAPTSIEAGLPMFNIPWLGLDIIPHVGLIIKYGVILAAIGLIESLMTLNLVDELTGTRGSGNRECIAQGSANILNGFFGGMGGCAMIGQSIINIKSGGRGRLSGIVAALALLVFILFAAPYIEMIPIAALVGVMFMVVLGTFAWSTFKILNKVPKMDIFVMVAVTIITVMEDLAVAVIAGVILSALSYAWQNALMIRARKKMDDHGIKHYEIFGPLFFASTTSFLEKFDYKNDPKEVIIDFAESRVVDQSAIETINKVAEKYENEGKTLHLRHLSPDCIKLIEKADKFCDVNVLEDPDYFVAIDSYKKWLKDNPKLADRQMAMGH